jgi:hypothetical protein
MAERVKARRLSDEEGQRLLRIVRRGEPKATKSVIRYRRAMVVLASAGGNSVPAVARLVAADEDTVREVIHRFNELGMRALDPRWGRRLRPPRPRRAHPRPARAPALAQRHARHPDVLSTQRRERARIRSEHHRRGGQPRQRTAA